jgi:hypothetical protein
METIVNVSLHLVMISGSRRNAMPYIQRSYVIEDL